jgi:hypothetical protein
MIGSLLTAIGLWAHYEKFYSDPQGLVLIPQRNFYTYVFDLTIYMVLIGVGIFAISLIGCIAALRENLHLMRIVNQFFNSN